MTIKYFKNSLVFLIFFRIIIITFISWFKQKILFIGCECELPSPVHAPTYQSWGLSCIVSIESNIRNSIFDWHYMPVIVAAENKASWFNLTTFKTSKILIFKQPNPEINCFETQTQKKQNMDFLGLPNQTWYIISQDQIVLALVRLNSSLFSHLKYFIMIFWNKYHQ